MGKIEDNKQQKLDCLLEKAYGLFMSKGISKTSVSDITREAGVAKGTFYLYFKDKYELRDKLIAYTSSKLFKRAYDAMNQESIPCFEDKIIYMVDHIVNQLSKTPVVLTFIAKNLSWGIFRQALLSNTTGTEIDFWDIYYKMIHNTEVQLKDPEIMLFLIVELASSTCHSAILYQDPISSEELLPYLNETIRSIIRNHEL
ncbi:MAG: TetR/AcrR family transcriptional regulator [Lachnospiraceae bacterium]